MTPQNEEAHLQWERHRQSSVFAVGQLHTKLKDGSESPADILDAYLFVKRTLAQSMQDLLLSTLPTSCPELETVRSKVESEMHDMYGSRIPATYLKAPFGGKLYPVLFNVLYENLGEEVDGGRLRIATKDQIHTERRTRELRELGLNVTWATRREINYYTLHSLEQDLAVVPGLVAKQIDKHKGLAEAEKERLLSIVEAGRRTADS